MSLAASPNPPGQFQDVEEVMASLSLVLVAVAQEAIQCPNRTPDELIPRGLWEAIKAINPERLPDLMRDWIAQSRDAFESTHSLVEAMLCSDHMAIDLLAEIYVRQVRDQIAPALPKSAPEVLVQLCDHVELYGDTLLLFVFRKTEKREKQTRPLRKALDVREEHFGSRGCGPS